MRVIGKGNTAEVMEWADGKVCKLFYEGYPYKFIQHEYSNAKLMEKMNLPVPTVYGIENIKNRTGIIYSRLYGSSMLETMLENENIVSLIKNMADLHKEILKCHTRSGMSYKKFLRSCIGEKHNQIYNKIEGFPDGDYLCHGDYHPDNIWIDMDGRLFVIDFMNVCCGPWQYDVARTFVLIADGNVPHEVPDREKVLLKQKWLADLYLQKMQVSYDDISEYIPIINICRMNKCAGQEGQL